MIKECPFCKKKAEMKSNQKYCSPQCKKNFENLLRNSPKNDWEDGSSSNHNASAIKYKLVCPKYLNETATAYWHKISPTVIERGHLNVLSEDAFAEMCDLHSRLMDINKAINKTNRSLLQLDEKWDAKNSVKIQSNKESALSDIKRKYSKLFLDYQKQFYLIPLSNRGNFGLDDKETVDPHDEFLSMGK